MIKIFRSTRNIAAVLLVAVILATWFMPTASAATKTVQNGSASSGIVCRVTTTLVSSATKPYTATQAIHNPAVAATTTIGVVSTDTVSVSASATISATVGASYCGISASATASLGISQTASHSIGQSVSYTLTSSNRAGKYRIVAVFPQYKTHFHIYKYTMKTTTVVVDRTIARIPSVTDAYHQLQRYGDL